LSPPRALRRDRAAAGNLPGALPGSERAAGVGRGAVFHLLQAILGLRADAPRRRLYVDPELPRWLPDLTLQGGGVGPAKVDLRFWREAEGTRWEAAVREGSVDLRHEQWRPWRVT